MLGGVIIVAAVVAWRATGVGSTTPPAAAPARARDASASTVVSVGRVRGLLVPAANPELGGRNPFAFGSAPRPPDAGARPGAPARTPMGEAGRPAAPPSPAALLSLSGVAESAGPDGRERTAIISTSREVYLVRVGDAVTARFVVSEIRDDAVVLDDRVSGERVELRLK